MNGFTTVSQYQWSSGKTKTSYAISVKPRQTDSDACEPTLQVAQVGSKIVKKTQKDLWSNNFTTVPNDRDN